MTDTKILLERADALMKFQGPNFRPKTFALVRDLAEALREEERDHIETERVIKESNESFTLENDRLRADLETAKDLLIDAANHLRQTLRRIDAFLAGEKK